MAIFGFQPGRAAILGDSAPAILPRLLPSSAKEQEQAVLTFMWQKDIAGVASFVSECLDAIIVTE